jgi:ribonuclease HII
MGAGALFAAGVTVRRRRRGLLERRKSKALTRASRTRLAVNITPELRVMLILDAWTPWTLRDFVDAGPDDRAIRVAMAGLRSD